MKQFTQEEINILGRIKSPDGKTAMELILSGRLRADESATTVQETTVQQPVTEPEKPHIYSFTANNYGGEGFTYNEKTTPRPVVVEPVQQTMPQPQIVVGRGPNTGSSLLDMFVNGAYASFVVIFIAAIANQERVGNLLSGKPYSVPILTFMVIGAIRFLFRMATSDGDVIYAATGRKKVEVPVGVPAPQTQNLQTKVEVVRPYNPTPDPIKRKDINEFFSNAGVKPVPESDRRMIVPVSPAMGPNEDGYYEHSLRKIQGGSENSPISYTTETLSKNRKAIGLVVLVLVIIGGAWLLMSDKGLRHDMGGFWESIVHSERSYENRIYFDKFLHGSKSDIEWLKSRIGNNTNFAIFEGTVSENDMDWFIIGGGDGENIWYFTGGDNFFISPAWFRPGDRVRVYVTYIERVMDEGADFCVVEAFPAMVERLVNGNWVEVFNFTMEFE